MKEPFYFSLSFKKIYYTQASILHSIAKKSLSIYDGSFLNQEKQRCILTMDLKSSTSKSMIDRSKVLAEFSQQSTNRHILKYPIQLIEMSLKNVYQLDFFIPAFDPSHYQQFTISIKAYKQNGQAVEVGSLIIDPNVFITLYKQQNMSYYQVNQRLFKDSINDRKSQFQRKVVDVVATYELGVAKSRFALQKALQENKKGINISQFRQTLRKFHMIRNNQEQEDYQLPNQSIHKQQNGLEGGDRNQKSDQNNSNQQFQYKIQVISPVNDRQTVPNAFKIQFEQRLIMEKAADRQLRNAQPISSKKQSQKQLQYQNHSSQQFQSIPLSISQRFKNFLRKKIQPQLTYINPSKQKTQEVINAFYKETTELKQLQGSLVHQSKSHKKTNQIYVSSGNRQKHQNQSFQSPLKQTGQGDKDKGDQKRHQQFPHHKKVGNWLQRGVETLTQNGVYKLKIIVFIIFSLFLMNMAMNPSRKVRPQVQYITEYQSNSQSYIQQFQEQSQN